MPLNKSKGLDRPLSSPAQASPSMRRFTQPVTGIRRLCADRAWNRSHAVVRRPIRRRRILRKSAHRAFTCRIRFVHTACARQWRFDGIRMRRRAVSRQSDRLSAAALTSPMGPSAQRPKEMVRVPGDRDGPSRSPKGGLRAATRPPTSRWRIGFRPAGRPRRRGGQK
jgi:hypothetical protein